MEATTYQRFKEKSVIIHRDENGFGLRVGGQNPVFVDFVHENGAAWKAGVRKDDRIIKVNGTLVRSYDHSRVVQMIQGCTPFVNLTLHSPETGNDIRISKQHSQTQQQQQQQQQQPINVRDNPYYYYKTAPENLSDSTSCNSSSTAPLLSSHLNQDQQQQQQANNIRDNPYYYYKTAPEKVSDSLSCNSSSTVPLLSSHLSQDQQQATSAKATTSLSMVRSRSTSKMSIRSTTGKYKPRNLRSRLVDDLRALTITNSSQISPSSLSTSPSSSDLLDCDDLETTRLDCSTVNSTLSNSPSSGGGVALAGTMTTANANNTSTTGGPIITKSKITTRRLEIIRELVETEKTHIEKLKQLNDLLYRPIKAEKLITPDQLKMVFSCHKTLFKIHRQIYKKLVAAQMNVSEVHQEPLVGKALIEIFDGELGKRLEKAASSFCVCQSTNSDLLNRITRKDTKSGEFLAQVATQQMLGRLGIKDLLASCFQRLTKYPLLLDNLLKATPYTGSSGMMHSKSLSEGFIAVYPAVQSGIIGNDATANLEEVEFRPESQQVDHPTVAVQPFISNATVSRSNSGASESTEESETETNDETITKNSSAISPIITTIQASTSTICANNTSVLSNCSHLSSSDEYAYERLCIERSLHLSRQILIHVNEAVNNAIAQNKLREVWKKTAFLLPPSDKSEEKKIPAIPVIDIETQQLLHEGTLTLRLSRRSFEVYVVLLTHYLVILVREGQDKYKLKYFTPDAKSTQHFSPVFNIDEHLVTRDSATDENGFYLLCKKKDDSRIYEFASQSPADRTKWKEKIHLAQMYNFAAVPENDNTLTRYTELISLSNDPVDEAGGGGKLVKVETSGLEEKIRQ